MHRDFLELLQLFASHRVRYLIIGGYAFSLQVEPRYTKDLDIWVDATVINGRRLLKALQEFGAPIANLTPEDIAKPGLLYIFGVPPLRVDLLNRVVGGRFAQAYTRRSKFDLGKTRISVVSRADLKRLKRAAGRPQDLADLAKLEAHSKIKRITSDRKGKI